LKSILRAVFGDLGNQFPMSHCMLKTGELIISLPRRNTLGRKSTSEVGALATVEEWADSDNPVGTT
jgi:hypothetical protein